MPENAAEAVEAAEAIAAGNAGDWGNVILWPADRVRAGDWTPVQWFDGALAESVVILEGNARLEPAGSRFAIGPAGQRIQDAYSVCDERTSESIAGFHGPWPANPTSGTSRGRRNAIWPTGMRRNAAMCWLRCA